MTAKEILLDIDSTKVVHHADFVPSLSPATEVSVAELPNDGSSPEQESTRPVAPAVASEKRAARPPEAPRADAATVEPLESQVVRGID